MPIAPTLILGLGGTGSKIVEKVAEKVRESGNRQSERIAFVVFDTDINDLGRIRQQSPEIYTVQTSTRNTVGEYLNINTNARDNWFPVNEMLNRKTLTEGAAQVRAISRLAFDTTLKGGNLDALHRAIEALFRVDKDQEEQSLRVIITSSLAGGTGSGLILSVAMYLANFLRTKYPKAKAITRGFFIQPDVFYTVIKATEEQQNLQVNAYAAVRELDAFLMKGDNTLPQQYRDLEFEFPKVGADGVEAVRAMPYDFCFLFDSNNASSGSLDSFATYLDHAATCIYTQSIGPMSKKSNSREDNVLREVIKNDGRNRYAGAGASRLVYPWQHVRDVVAYQWANEALSKQWLQFDEQFRDQQVGIAKQRSQGFAVRDLDLPTVFIKAVDFAAEKKEPFARSILSQCMAYDEDGISVVGDRWGEYLQALKVHVRKASADPNGDGLKRNAQARIATLGDSAEPEDYVATYEELVRFHDLVERHAEETAGILGYSLFQSGNETITKDQHEHQLETYLRDKVTGRFIHPVSARYFLYQTYRGLLGEKQQAQTSLDRTVQYFEGFERSAFDNPETEEIEGAADYLSRRKTLKESLRGRPGAEKLELIEKLRQFVKRVDDLRELSVYVSVLDEALKYVEGMAKSFETFFTALEGNLKRLRTQIDLLRTKYDDLTGLTTRYVLASSRSVDSLYHSMPYTGGLVSIDSELAESIYSKVREYSMLTDEKDGSYFQDLYANTIIRYFADQVMESYGPQIKIDIIEALEREYRTLEKNYEEANVIHYVTSEIDKAKKLASPFLEQPLGEERHPIEACAYNPAIEGDSDPKRKSLISEHLGNYGGEQDDEISPQEILFYNAIYGIRARDLSKYSPERRHATEWRAAGAYFSSYYQLVSGIVPSVAETKVITPHIDRRWHSISWLPDLDEGNQAQQLARIHTALLVGLVYRKISWTPVQNNRRVYRFRPDGDLERDFVVSNGTPCDQFYEVVDALTNNPVAVAGIIESVERQVAMLRQETRAVAFEDTSFARALTAGLPLPELASVIPALKKRPLGLFDVVAFYAVSIPNDKYSDVEIRSIVHNFLDYLRSDVASLSDAEDDVPVMETVLREQFDRFAENLPFFVESEGPAFVRKVRTMLRPLTDLADELHLRSFANELAEFDDLLLNTI